MRRGLLSVVAALVVLGLAGVGQDGYAASPPAPRATAPSSPSPAAGPFVAKMAGANETPPNKSTGTGTAKVTMDVQHNQACWNLSVQKLQGTVTKAEIQRAPAGKSGPTVLNLSPPSGGSSHGCKAVGPPLARGIVKHPDTYYVNVLTSKFPNGEVRGQL